MSAAARAAELLRSTATVRERAAGLLARARAGGSEHFEVDAAGLQAAADLVAQVTRERYPTLRIPFHSRWRHFEAGGVDRKASMDAALESLAAGTPSADTAEPARRQAADARARIDLALVSVLLDAGAGADWAFDEPGTGLRLGRSEGLGVASFHAFMQGMFSSDPSQPLRADAQALRAITTQRLARAFQAGPSNPLVGLEGRAALLRRLGDALAAQPEVFGTPGRPGGLFDALLREGPVHATGILALLLSRLGSIWPAGNTIEGIALGDCWRHPAAHGPGLSEGWMPFHKLSQWLSYSLLEPFAWAGVPVQGLDQLTGLPEYRNGGLLLDSGALRLKHPAQAAATHQVGDPLVVEWRALTVALLDELAPLVRQRLGLDAAAMPLACVLEGGTWAAGRVMAQRLRGGSPPLSIQSDGTVF